MCAGAGYWWSTPAHRQEVHIEEKVTALEKALGPRYEKHKEDIKHLFGLVDRNADGEITPDEVEAHVKELGEAPAGGEGLQWSKAMIFCFVGLDVLGVFAAGCAFIYSKWRQTPKAVMHGTGKLLVEAHCAGKPSVPHTNGATVAPGTAPSAAPKGPPIISLTFDKSKANLDEVRVNGSVPVTDAKHEFRLKKPLAVDFDYVNKKAKDTDPEATKFPRRWFHVEAMHKTDKGNETVCECEVDIAALVQQGDMTLYLGEEVQSGICRRRSGTLGELTISGIWEPDLPAAPPAAPASSK